MRKGEKFYKRINIKGQTVLLHRYVMECHLSRTLSPDEIVHHVNGDTLDNRIENLQIMTNAEHVRLEQTGKRHSLETRQKHRLLMLGNKQALGTIRSQDAIERTRQKQIGAKRSAKTRANISQSLIGNKNNLGQKRSPETRRKISEANKRRWANYRITGSKKFAR